MSDVSAPDSHAFQVDLRGLVDLLSHHLYSSPRVFVRELMQNAVDAVTARRALEDQAAGDATGGTDANTPGTPDTAASSSTPGAAGGPSATSRPAHARPRPGVSAPAPIRLLVDDSGLHVHDPGIGLTEADVHRFLATIGRSSKRDDLVGARQEFLGQFGIGLLACFTVAQSIRVVTKSAADPAAPPVEWLAAADGRYQVRVLAAGEPGAPAEPGTTVHLTPRPGAERWFQRDRVLKLARDYGALLPYPIEVEADGIRYPVSDAPPVWDRDHPTSTARRLALLEYGAATLGFAPLDLIELDLPLAGVRGVAYVLPSAGNPSESGRHRVSLKGMLLSDSATGLLPDWAFFVRCVIDTDTLRPTASREGLYEDETLGAIREALGGQVRDWLTRLAAEDPQRLAAFLSVHTLGVKALARHDLDLLRIMLPFLHFETTDGLVPLTEFARTHGTVHVSSTVEEFRQVAPIAAAQGIGVVNGGYTYDAELVARLPEVIAGVAVDELRADIVAAHLDLVDPAEELALAPFLTAARAVLDPLDCDVLLRSFHPVSVPALHLDNRAARQERARAETEAAADELWAEILGALKSTAPRVQLVLNCQNPVVKRIAGIADPALQTAAVEALYGQALLMTHRPLRPADTALLNRTFGELLSWAAKASRANEDR
ncbi:MAG TPA: HSP90 family protein [Actinocrinis sp.]|nr:HSP90 family protein [Actinocrinis sp.]